jgi:hypothetical protein
LAFHLVEQQVLLNRLRRARKIQSQSPQNENAAGVVEASRRRCNKIAFGDDYFFS